MLFNDCSCTLLLALTLTHHSLFVERERGGEGGERGGEKREREREREEKRGRERIVHAHVKVRYM